MNANKKCFSLRRQGAERSEAQRNPVMIALRNAELEAVNAADPVISYWTSCFVIYPNVIGHAANPGQIVEKWLMEEQNGQPR